MVEPVLEHKKYTTGFYLFLTFRTGIKSNCGGLNEKWTKESDWQKTQKVSQALLVSRVSAQHPYTAASLANIKKHHMRGQVGQTSRTGIHHIALYTLVGNFNRSMLKTKDYH